MENLEHYIPMLVFIPLMIGSIVGLAFVLMLMCRLVPMPVDKPDLLNRVAKTLAAGNREKAVLLLEEDNHPISSVLSFTFKHTMTSLDDLKGVFDYASLKMEKHLTSGSKTLVWLTIWIPLFTILMYFVVPERPSGNLLTILIFAMIAKIIFWNLVFILSKMKASMIISRGEDHFNFLSGLVVEDEALDDGLQGLVDQKKDIVDLSPGIEKISKGVKGKSDDQD